MRKDLQRLEDDRIASVVDALGRRGVSDEVIAEALAEADDAAAA